MQTLRLAAAALLALTAASARAGQPEVVSVVATPSAAGWRFDVAVRHGDTGWEHYADAWEVRLPSGEVLGTRALLHPHETEQPFTRSLTGVAIPEDAAQVEVRARDSVHGWGEAVTVDLPR